MSVRKLSIATCNLYNLNLPGLPIYRDQDGWSEEAYGRKIAFMAQTLREDPSDVWGFQELWHNDALGACFDAAGIRDQYQLLLPPDHTGQSIVCAAAVRHDLLVDTPEWIDRFPDELIMQSGGDDDQTSEISVKINRFSRPVLHLQIRPRDDRETIHVYVCHFKSKAPTRVNREGWYKRNTHAKHAEAIGSAISTIRRTAEAAALRVLLTAQMKNNDTPVIVLGDLNDGQHSNTLNVLTGQPRYLLGDSRGGGDTDLYTAGTLQEYRSLRDVYYTHIHENVMESLDHILVSQEFYDHSRKRIWAFDGLDVRNDHLNDDDHKINGSTDHGVIRARFRYDPA